VYANASVPNGNHIFVIHSPRGIDSDASLVLFDYVQYTYDNASSTLPSSSTSLASTATETSSHSKVAVGAIAGGTIGVSVVLLLIVGTILFQYCRRRHRSNGISHHNPSNAPGMAYLDTNIPIAAPSGSPSQLITPPSTHLRKAEISRELEDRQQALAAALGEVRPAHYPSFSSPMSQTAVDTVHRRSDTVLESQVEDLNREVARLREKLESMGDEAPPQYRDLD